MMLVCYVSDHLNVYVFFVVIGLFGTHCQFWTSVFSLFLALLKITADIEQVTEAEVCSRAAH